jgi:carbonic anhydrase
LGVSESEEEREAIMHRRQALKVFAGLALCPLCAAAGFAEEAHGSHWSYEGATGPDKWGTLDAANGICSSGSQQSPLDLMGLVSTRQPRLEIRWSKRPDTIVNNGHTIQLNFAAGDALKVGDKSYALTQFHFHHPSEHLVDGKAFAMEAHFVHADEGGGLAVVGVFMVPGRANAVFNKIVSTMPAEESPPVPAHPAIDPNGLLPARGGYYRYEGSLTTPPCSETVNWLVLAERIEVAEADIARFAKLYPMNARPVQNRNRRFILSSGRA